MEVVVEAWPLVELAGFMRQSRTLCPGLPQNKHKLLSIRHCCSCWVNFPLESSFLVRSSFVDWGFGVSFDFPDCELEDWELLLELD